MTFHDFFHDLFKFSQTLGLAVTFKNSKIFLVLEYFLTLNSSTDKLWRPPKCMPFTLFNYSSLSYIFLALSSAVTKLSNKNLVFQNFQGLTIKFHHFPGLENEILKFHNFPGVP